MLHHVGIIYALKHHKCHTIAFILSNSVYSFATCVVTASKFPMLWEISRQTSTSYSYTVTVD